MRISAVATIALGSMLGTLAGLSLFAAAFTFFDGFGVARMFASTEENRCGERWTDPCRVTVETLPDVRLEGVPLVQVDGTTRVTGSVDVMVLNSLVPVYIDPPLRDPPQCTFLDPCVVSVK